MTDLSTRYLGYELRSPLIASASPATRSVDRLVKLEAAGVGAVVLPSLFEEEVEAEPLRLAERMEAGAGVSAEASDYFPDMDFPYLLLDRQLQLVRAAADALTVPVIASLNGTSAGGWVRYACELVDAGADALELNMYDVVTDPTLTAADVEAGYLALVREVRSAVDVPLAIKLSPYFTSFGHFALEVADAGADGLVLFNRFYQPDVDLETRDVRPTLDLSHAGESRLPLRWIALLQPHLDGTSLALTSGVHAGTEIAKGLLAGADAVMAASELLRRGPQRAAEMLDELRQWMQESGYDSVAQLRGSLTTATGPDAHAYERAQYQQVLGSWR